MRFPFMPTPTRLLAAGMAVVLTSSLFAQATDETQPTELPTNLPPGFQLPPQLARIAYWDRNVWTVSASLRFNSASPSISFGNLGSIPYLRGIPGADQGSIDRGYDDGGVLSDDYRVDELLDDGTPFTSPNTRYAGNEGNGLFVGDYLSYTPGQTRYWRYLNQDQIVGNQVAMHLYSASSAGGSMPGIEDSSPIGFDLQMTRRALRLSERTEINLALGIGLSTIKARNSGSVVSNLEVMTDLYDIYGTAPSEVTTFPSYGPLRDGNGNIIRENGVETTVPLQDVTANRSFSTFANAAVIDGDWELKGAYYALRLGPQLRSHLTESFAISVGAGVGGAYVGTDFTSTETISSYFGGNRVLFGTVGVRDVANHSEYIFGFYGEATAEYWLTPRTALTAGVLYEGMGDYEQVVRGRTAKVELGSGLVARIGITTRF